MSRRDSHGPVREGLMVVIDEIQGVYEANYQRHHPGAPMPPRVPDETLAQMRDPDQDDVVEGAGASRG